MITGTGLTFAYRDAAVVRDVSLVADEGLVTGLVGPNGSGKTTLLRMLYGALEPQSGLVSVDGHRLRDLSPRELARKVAVVVQEPQSETTATVGEAALLGRLPHLHGFARPDDEDHAVTADALDRVGVGHLGRRDFAGLSGGERQRVLIARAVAQQATHLLLDEPTNHLDIRFQHEILGLVRRLGSTTVVVLHDLNLAARYCDHLVMLDRGRIAGEGPPHEVLRPELIRDVYGIEARRIDIDGMPNLLFSPLPTHIS